MSAPQSNKAWADVLFVSAHSILDARDAARPRPQQKDVTPRSLWVELETARTTRATLASACEAFRAMVIENASTNPDARVCLEAASGALRLESNTHQRKPPLAHDGRLCVLCENDATERDHVTLLASTAVVNTRRGVPHVSAPLAMMSESTFFVCRNGCRRLLEGVVVACNTLAWLDQCVENHLGCDRQVLTEADVRAIQSDATLGTLYDTLCKARATVAKALAFHPPPLFP